MAMDGANLNARRAARERTAPGRCPRHRGRPLPVVGDGPGGRPRDDAGVRPQSDRLRRVVHGPIRGAAGRRDGRRAPPSRTIILQTDGSKETRLRAWISAQCEFLGSSDHSGSEQVMLEASGDGVRQLPGTVIPLLIPEVPVVLWWPGDGLFNHPVFPALMDASDQLVVDSGSFADSLTILSRLHALATEDDRGRQWRLVAQDHGRCARRNSGAQRHINTMVDQLKVSQRKSRASRARSAPKENSAATRRAGRRGHVEDLTDSVNAMASNLTAQVRNIAEVTTAVAKGDLRARSRSMCAAKSSS